MVMFDSLNRHMLPAYGCDWTHAPNFARLAQRTVTFDRSYVCSMPCMPARRDFHTGRPSMLHRGWGPLEPFDDSVPQMLTNAGVSTHLISDHYHYWEDGGCTYHPRYSTWQFFRGQEGDPWMGQVAPPTKPPHINGKGRDQDWINRQFMTSEQTMPQNQTFAAGIDFIDRNHQEDNWFLQIETFDPHEPFYTQRQYKDHFARHYDNYQGPLFDWPGYRKVAETPEQIEHLRHEYASLLAMCDARMGDILDTMDRHDMWDDTMLIVWTDHGFLLGEHDCWAKNWMPMFEQVAHTPFFVWDPRSGKAGERREALVQPAIDLGPTLLEAFGLEPTQRMLGKVLRDTISGDKPVRDAAIFGYNNARLNVTDGRYVYMRGNHAADVPTYQYTLMPTNMRHFFTKDQLVETTLTDEFSFTRGNKVLRVPGGKTSVDNETDALFHNAQGDLLFDVETDPQQQTPLNDAGIEAKMVAHMKALMRECEAPAEQYERLGLA